MERLPVKRRFLILLLVLTVLLVGCGKADNGKKEYATAEIARNDWYGAIQRISNIIRDSSEVVNVLTARNTEIVIGNPNDYWSDGYFYLHFNPVDSVYMPYTKYFNEEQDWDTIESNVIASIGETDSASVTKLRNNEYFVSWTRYDTHPIYNELAYSTKYMTCIYDASHDWAQMIESTEVFNEEYPYEEAFYEFAELSPGTYAIQNERERLYCEYDSNGKLVTLYYSILGLDDREIETTIEEETEEVQMMSYDTLEEYTVEIVTKEEMVFGQFTNRYNSQDDTIFARLNDINKEWVLSEKTISQYIVFENDVLTFKVKNSLTGELEGFSVANKILEPVFNKKTGLYYDPNTNEITTIEEYEARIAAMEQQIVDIQEEEVKALEEKKLEEEAKAKSLEDKKKEEAEEAANNAKITVTAKRIADAMFYISSDARVFSLDPESEDMSIFVDEEGMKYQLASTLSEVNEDGSTFIIIPYTE